jgi:hypothetical protein
MPDRAIMALVRAFKDSLFPSAPPDPAPAPSIVADDEEIDRLKQTIRHEGHNIEQCAQAVARVLARTPVEQVGRIIHLTDRREPRG